MAWRRHLPRSRWCRNHPILATTYRLRCPTSFPLTCAFLSKDAEFEQEEKDYSGYPDENPHLEKEWVYFLRWFINAKHPMGAKEAERADHRAEQDHLNKMDPKGMEEQVELQSLQKFKRDSPVEQLNQT